MLLTIIIFVVIISVLVFVHELGHFYSAKKSGVAVEEFGFGFPPRIWGFKKGETIYSINLIPLGGFVKIKGESGDQKDQTDSFSNQNFWRKFLILISGVGMNVALAFILISFGFMIGLPTTIDDNQVNQPGIRDQKIQINYVYKNSAAASSGLAIGDIVKSIDNQNFTKVSEMQAFIKEKQNTVLHLEIIRGHDLLNKDLTPISLPDNGSDKVLGVSLVNVATISYNPLTAIGKGFLTTFSLLWQILLALVLLIKSLIMGVNVSDQVSGPIGVAVLTAQVTKMGWIYVLQFTSLLSLNLALINVLPFPALDGGRILFIIIEKLRGKPNNEKIESVVHTIGFSLLMVLIAFITYKDLLRYGQGIISFFKNIVS